MRSRFFLSFLLIIFLIFSFSVVSLGANLTSFMLDTETDELVAGETITLTLKMEESNIDGGISVLSGEIVYDSDVFDSIELLDVNGWSLEFNEATNKFVTTGSSNAKDGVLSINLKVRDGSLNIQDTVVEVINLVTADSDDREVEIGDVLCEIGEESSGSVVNTESTENGENSTNASSEDTEKSPKKIVFSSVGVVIFIIVIAFLFLYIKVRKMMK